MTINPYSIPPLLAAFISFVLGLAIYRLDRSNDFHKSFFYFSLSCVTWLLAHSFVLNSTNMAATLLGAQIMFFAMILTLPTLYHMAVALTHTRDQKKILLVIIYGLGFLGSLMSFHPDFFAGIHRTVWGLYPAASVWMLGIVFFIVLCLALSFITLTVYHFSLVDAMPRRQTRGLMLLFLVVMAAYLDIFSAYSPSIYPTGYLPLLGFDLGISCFKLSSLNRFMKERSRQCEREVSSMVEQLDHVQDKLLLTGKNTIFSNISAGIIHQLTQPITAINGIAKFMKGELDSHDKSYRPISLINEQASYLRDMIEDLMALMRHREIKRDYFDIYSVIEKTLELLTDELRIKRVSWDLHLGKSLPKVYADTIHLQQIFMNIIINAIQALATLPQGTGRYLFISSAFNHQQKCVEVTFKDTGPGISLKEKEKIFEPFFSTREQGAGIGLSFCQGLLNQMGGQIAVDSAPGRGATFCVKIPIEN